MLRLSDTYDLVLGSRWVPGGGAVGWPWYRRMVSRCGSLYARTVLGVPVRDLTGGFKCFRRRVLEQVDLDGIRSTGYAFQIEMTYRALRHGFSVVEMPITFAERAQGRSKMSHRIMLEAVVRVVQLRIEAPPRH
jgi:dolichol-phosphate mannosyltransferase